MNPFERLQQLQVKRLQHCPPRQLVKGSSASAGFDLCVADNIVVPTNEMKSEAGQYSWERGQLLSSLTEAQQEFIKAQASEDAFGLSVVDAKGKVLVEKSTYAPPIRNYSFYVCPEGYVHRKLFDAFYARTGIVVTPTNPDWFAIYPRSGVSIKYHLGLENTVGVIDPDYPLEWLLALEAKHDAQVFYAGERIAQMIIHPQIRAEIKWVGSDDVGGDYGGMISTLRTGGFGSTGV